MNPNYATKFEQVVANWVHQIHELSYTWFSHCGCSKEKWKVRDLH
jgi:hypothetical protein